MRKVILLLFPVLLLMDCHQSDHVWNEASNRVVIEVRKTLNDYFKDINADGPLAELKYLDSSAMFSWHPPGFTGPIDFDSVKTILMDNSKSGIRSTVSWDSLSVFPENSDKAKYTGKITVITKGDTVHLSEEGNLIKREDGWKLVSGKTVLEEFR